MGVKEKQDEVGEDEEAEIHKCANVSAEPRSYGSSSAMQSFKPPPPSEHNSSAHTSTHSFVCVSYRKSIHPYPCAPLHRRAAPQTGSVRRAPSWVTPGAYWMNE